MPATFHLPPAPGETIAMRKLCERLARMPLTPSRGDAVAPDHMLDDLIREARKIMCGWTPKVVRDGNGNVYTRRRDGMYQRGPRDPEPITPETAWVLWEQMRGRVKPR